MSLGVFAVGTGNHIAGWRHPGATKDSENIATFVAIGQAAERGKLDFMFLADNVQCNLEDHPGFVARLEPFTTLTAVGTQTSRLGLVGSGSSSWTEPYNLARLVGSLDHISHGRAGWNLVTTSTATSAANFGSEPIAHDKRYENAEEFIEVVKGLWDSWEPDAKVVDVGSGQYIDVAKIHRLDYEGERYSVRGPLNMSRCPQGQPVIFQAGSSTSGQAFATKYADVVFTVQIDLDVAQGFYAGVKKGVVENGRDPGHSKIMPGFLPVVGGTEEEARAKLDTLVSYVDDTIAQNTMADRIGHDFSGYPLDGPIPDMPFPEEVQGYARMMLTEEYRKNHTLRDLYNLFAISRGYIVACGSPEQVTDIMEEWFTGEGCDGFIVAPAHFPEALDDFVDGVIPVLQQRGLFRQDYSGPTLRDHLGIPKPANRYI